MNIKQKKLLANTFFHSQFNYNPLIWMFHSRELNNKINQVHERCLRLVYNDKKSSFQEFLCKDNSVSIHVKNIRTLASEMFKVYNRLSPEIVLALFPRREMSYNLRNKYEFTLPLAKSTKHGTERITFLGHLKYGVFCPRI